MNLPDSIQEKLNKLGISELNEMQVSSYSAILENKNVMIKAPTGSGKTLAFLLPLIQLIDPKENEIQCLVISPTRELCLQIESVWKQLSTGLKVNTFYGGHSMPQEITNLSNPPSILIGTPGRLADHVSRKTINCKSIKYVVFDEFDKSLTLGFQDQIEYLVDALQKIEKKIMVSATSSIQVPKFIEFEPHQTINFTINETEKDSISFKKIIATENQKPEMLYSLLSQLEDKQAIIFCNQRDEVENLSAWLKSRKVNHITYHGGLDQDDRERALIKFRNKSTYYLITTDLGARGLDIPNVSYVIHYELPMKNHEFTHRNGRTARMNAQGEIIIFEEPNKSNPDYLPKEIENFSFNPLFSTIDNPIFTTIYLSGGKKEKINKVDIIGFFCQKGNLDKQDIGLIQVNDHQSFAAVRNEKVDLLINSVQTEKIKGKKLKIAIAY